jgi:hypothetical protein
VDKIANDDGLLGARARELTGKDMYFARQIVEVHHLESFNCKTASAVLVQPDGEAGAIHVHGNKLNIIMTGPDQGEGWWLIALELGQYHASRVVCNVKKPVCWGAVQVSLQGLRFKPSLQLSLRTCAFSNHTPLRAKSVHPQIG